VFLSKPYRALSRDGETFLQILSDNYFSSCPSRDPQIRTLRPVGKYETVLLNGERIALLGNLRLGIFAGLSMGLFVRVSVRRTGERR